MPMTPRTHSEFRRVLKPSGKAHAFDSDFAMLAIDPVPPSDWRALLDAAAHAFRTPNIGRKLYGLAKAAGFSSVDAQIMSTPETKGRLLNFAKNIAGYACEASTLDEQSINSILDTAEAALEDGRYLAVNPQFVVSIAV